MAKAAATKTPATNTPAAKVPAKPASKPVSRAAPVKAHAAASKTPAAKTPAAAPKGTAPKAAPPKARPEADAKEKGRKIKLVRDSFTMPEAEYAVLGDVKKACLKAGIEVKKSELLRVGVALIRQLDTVRLKEILGSLPTLKAGRPKKSK